MRTSGKAEFNPASASQANYATLHNGAHLNVVMQITLATFFYIFFYGSESQSCWEELEPIMRMRHFNFYFFDQKKVRGGKYTQQMKEELECLHSSKQNNQKRIWFFFLFIFYLSPDKKKRDQLCSDN